MSVAPSPAPPEASPFSPAMQRQMDIGTEKGEGTDTDTDTGVGVGMGMGTERAVGRGVRQPVPQTGA